MSGEQEFQAQVIRMLNDLTTKVAGVSERVARLEAGNAERCSARGDIIESMQAKHVELERRVRRMENVKTYSVGKKAGAVGIIAAATAVVFEVFSKWGPKW